MSSNAFISKDRKRQYAARQRSQRHRARNNSLLTRSIVLEQLVLLCVHSLLITMSDLSEFLKQQSPLSPSNLYRKQYGNLEHVFAVEIFASLFAIENSVIQLQPLGVLKIALDKKHLTQELYYKCLNMHTFKREHDLKTLKVVGKNECKVCKEVYTELVNTQKLCDGKDHIPRYNFALNEDVFKCEIA